MEASFHTQLTHPKLILVATNLSDLHRLMPFALQMAGESGAKLQLLHVLPMTAEIAANAAGMPYYDRDGAISTAKNLLEPWCERARKLGLQCTVMIGENSPVAWEIFAVARRIHPDRLILPIIPCSTPSLMIVQFARSWPTHSARCSVCMRRLLNGSSMKWTGSLRTNLELRSFLRTPDDHCLSCSEIVDRCRQCAIDETRSHPTSRLIVTDDRPAA